MANRKLSIGCVLLMGGALTNCGGTVETRGEGPEERGGQGGSGFVGVPIYGGFQGTIAGSTGIGFGGYVGTCCPGTGGYTPGAGGYVGVPPIGGEGGYVGVQVGGGAGPYDGGAGGYGGEVGVPPEAGAAGWGGEGGNGGDDGF